MENSLVERHIENAVEDMFDDKAVRFMKGVSKLAARQGGETTIDNYKLLGKRALIVAGAAILAVQVTTSIVGLVASRKSEEQRIEKVVRRVLDEEGLSAGAEA